MDDNKEKFELIKKSFELKNLKKYKEALEALYKALEYDDIKDDNVELLSQIGNLHILLNNNERALEEFQRALSINQKHEYSLQKCYEIYIKQNKISKALNLASKMCEENKTPQNYYNYLNALIKSNKIQDALEVFSSLDDEIRIEPNILYLIASICPDKKKFLLEKIVQIAPNNLRANLDLIKIEYDEKNYDKIIKYAMNIDDENPLVYYYLALVEVENKNYPKAIKLFIDAIKIDNDEHDIYLPLARVYVELCRFDDALVALKKSINYSLIKEDKKALDEKYFLVGWILIKNGDDSKALLNLGAVDKESIYYSKAEILIQTINLKNSNLAKAKSVLEDYYKKENDNLILIDTLACVYKELKFYDKAIDLYNKALRLYPNSIFYKLEIIDLLIDDKNYDKAHQLIIDFEKEYNNCPSVYNSLTRIYYRLKEYSNALNSIDKYIELDNNAPEALYFKGLILNDMEKYDDAKSVIYNAIKLDPTKAKYYHQMSRSYNGLKEYKNALLYSKEAIEIDPNEINYKKQAYEISLKIGNEAQILMYKNQLIRSEKVLKMQR